MDLTQTITNALLVAAVGAVLGWMVHGLRSELKGDIAEVKADIRDLRRDVTDLRSDLTQVALAVGAKPRASSE